MDCNLQPSLPLTNPSVIPMMAATASRQRTNYAVPDDWDRHRATIERLYVYEEKTLRETRKYMELAHAFFAT